VQKIIAFMTLNANRYNVYIRIEIISLRKLYARPLHPIGLQAKS